MVPIEADQRLLEIVNGGRCPATTFRLRGDQPSIELGLPYAQHCAQPLTTGSSNVVFLSRFQGTFLAPQGQKDYVRPAVMGFDTGGTFGRVLFAR